MVIQEDCKSMMMLQLPQVCGTRYAMMIQTCIVIWVGYLVPQNLEYWRMILHAWRHVWHSQWKHSEFDIMLLPSQSTIWTSDLKVVFTQEVDVSCELLRGRYLLMVRMFTMSSFWRSIMSQDHVQKQFCHLQKYSSWGILKLSALPWQFSSLSVTFGTGVSDPEWCYTSALQITTMGFTCFQQSVDEMKEIVLVEVKGPHRESPQKCFQESHLWLLAEICDSRKEVGMHWTLHDDR